MDPLEGKALTAIALPPAFITIYEGSVSASKTITTLLEWVRYCRTAPPGLLLMCGKTERTVRDNLIYPLQEWLGKDRVVWRPGTGTATILGRDVLVVGANNEQARTKIQGLTLAGAYVDEAAELPESFFNMLVSRLRVPGARMWATANPGGPAHWLKKKWLDRARRWLRKDGSLTEREDFDPAKDLDLNRATFLIDDNAYLLRTNPRYVAQTKAAYTGLWKRRYIDAEWVVAEGAVYDMWDESRHVVKHADLPVMERVLAVGADYGTTNPTRAYLLGYADETLWTIAEWAPPKGTDAELSAGLIRWLQQQPAEWASPEWVFVDPAAASWKLQLRRDGMSNTRNGTNSVLPGIRTIGSLLALDRLKVSDRCTHLIEQLPGYSWDPKATEKGEDAPLKVDDHEVDALRYAVQTSRRLWRNLIPLTATIDEPDDDLEEAA